MSKVYLAISGAPDKLLGHVDESGKVSRSQIGLDKQIGYVNLATGEIYESHFGPDKTVGRVETSSGKVYATRWGPDKYVGWVRADGHIYRHKALAPDEYIGQVDPALSFAHAAAAMVLLVLPALEVDASSDAPDDPDETNQ
ncbi:MAG TPA: hypothetical protein P5121_29620 [Caldilineaceae bacterium]|nr:hypothetical protein [Caldilineaceae bacterium]